MRKEFSAAAKTLAAKKVNYLCSCPDCKRITVGSYSMKNVPLPNANAAHIYPASKGGPRFDPKIDKSFITSEENCLWLCPTHHSLVDKDDQKYNAPLLLEWKKKAEDFANSQLQLSTISFGEIKDKIKDINFLESVFNNYVIEGKFQQLLLLIQKIEETSLDSDLVQIVSLYKIISYYYVNYSLVKEEIRDFFSINNKLVLDKLFIFLIENNAREQLCDIKIFSPEKYKEFVEIIVERKIIGRIIGFNKETADGLIEGKKEKSLIDNLLLNYFFCEKREYFPVIVPLFIGNNSSFTVNFVFKMRWSIMKLIVELQTTSHDLYKHPDYIWLQSIEKQVYELDVKYQSDYWKFMLTADRKAQNFDEIFKKIPTSVVIDQSFDMFMLAHQVEKDENNVKIDNLVEKSISFNNFNLLLTHLYEKYLPTPGLLSALFKQFPDLINRNIDLLTLYHINQVKINTPFEATELKQKFEALYGNEIVFHLILADLFHRKGCIKDFETESSIAERLFKGKGSLSMFGFQFWLNLIEQTKSYEKAELFLDIPLLFDFKIRLSNILLNSNSPKLLEKGYETLLKLKEEGNQRTEILNLIGYYFSRKGNISEARKYFEESFGLMPNDYAAIQIINSKINNSESLSSKEISFAESSSNYSLCRLILSYFKIKNEVAKVKEIYIRLFSINDMNDIGLVNDFFGFIASHSEDPKQSHYIQSGFTIELTNDDDTLFISLHKEIEFGRIVNNSFFGSIHYSESDRRISSFLLKKKGETINFGQKPYTISSIVSNDFFMYQRAYELLKKEEKIMVFEGDINKPEEGIKAIFAFLEEKNKQTQDLIDFFDKNPITPLTLLGKNLGKSLLNVMEFLLSRSDKPIVNNIENNLGEKILLSYDAVIPLFNLKEILNQRTLGKFSITSSTKGQLILDIENETVDINCSNSYGYLSSVSGKVSFTEYNEEMKRSRHEYLLQIKEFIKSLPEVSPIVPFSDENEYLLNLKRYDLNLELDILSFCKQNTDFVILTDNLFMNNYAKILGLKSTGLISLFTFFENVSFSFVDFIKKIISFKYYFYFPLPLFEIILKDFECASEQTKKSILENYINVLDGKIFNFDEKLMTQHKKLIIYLYAEYIKTGTRSGEIYDELFKKSLQYIKDLFPDDYNKMIEKTINETFGC